MAKSDVALSYLRPSYNWLQKSSGVSPIGSIIFINQLYLFIIVKSIVDTLFVYYQTV